MYRIHKCKETSKLVRHVKKLYLLCDIFLIVVMRQEMKFFNISHKCFTDLTILCFYINRRLCSINTEVKKSEGKYLCSEEF